MLCGVSRLEKEKINYRLLKHIPMGIFSFLSFSNKSIKDYLLRGAIIIDVRSPSEYDRGKIRGSLNIPSDQVIVNAVYIRSKNKPIIIVGAGDTRNNEAIRILQETGIKDIVNGGHWEKVAKIIQTL